jgi:hypothetical protein
MIRASLESSRIEDPADSVTSSSTAVLFISTLSHVLGRSLGRRHRAFTTPVAHSQVQHGHAMGTSSVQTATP